ncbi:MAG: RIO1 family regulatory kinase/ATPase [Kofleriaceae bacterium]
MTDKLDVLIADGVIDEVLGRLKSGKEANISLVRRGDAVIAAKVYKDRSTRSFKNNADYKEGRKVRNSRTQRAIESGGSFGRDAAEQAWKSAEADALYKLAASDVRVPRPLMFYEGVLLMELVLDSEGRPAPRLIDVAIERDAALGIYADLVAQIISMLCCDLIHGDLSPYNILAAADGPTIIDFPQVVSAVHSTRAEYFFLRDFDNVVRFLAGFDPSLAVHAADGRAIWRAYVSRDLTPQFVPPPPPPPRPTRGPDRRSPPPQGRDGRPQQARDRGPQQPQRPRGDSRPNPRGDGRPNPFPQQRPRADDGRPNQRGDGRPNSSAQQPQRPRADGWPDPQTQRPHADNNPRRDGRPNPQPQQTQRPHSDSRPNPQPQRPGANPLPQYGRPQPAPARSAETRPSNAGRRRRPKRRW